MDLESFKFSKKIDAHLEKLGLLGKVITFGAAIFVIFAPFFISYWILDAFFTTSTISEGIQILLFVVLGFLIQGVMYWVFVAEPTSLKSRFSKQIYDVLGELNKELANAEELGLNVEIKEKQDGQYFSAEIFGPFKNNPKISDCETRVLKLINKLNVVLEKAREHNIKVSVKMNYWGPNKLQTKRYKYHFGASITPE